MLDVAKLGELAETRPSTEFVRDLVRGWKLGGTPLLPGAVRQALEERFSELFVLFRGMASGTSGDPSIGHFPDWIHLDHLAAARLAFTAFENSFARPGGKKWALCFDELELAPDWLQNRLFRELRSTDQRFLIKVSTSPLPNIGEDVWATPSEDYAVMRLWPHGKAASRDFSKRLAAQIVERREGGPGNLESFLGASSVGATDEESYERGGPAWEMLRELARKDREFETLLQAKGLDPEDPRTDDGRLKDQILRKAKPLAYFRVAWRTGHEGKGTRSLRTRKRPRLYHGVEDVLDIADGNPRWLITILRELLREWETRKVLHRGLPPEDQEEVLRRISELFIGFLRSLPERRTSRGIGIPVSELVDLLGKAFEENILKKPFSLNPVGTVRAEESLAEALEASLEWAAEQGALVVMDPAEHGLDKGVEGRRLRLTYLLAPYYRLPLRAYKAGALSACLISGGLSEERLRQLELWR